MQTLPAPPTAAAVLSFDFDGTLHDPAETPPVPVAFFETIEFLRREHGAVWGINTGRAMPQVVDGLIESRFPFLPDWVISREREIYLPNAFGRWLPVGDWNQKCEKDIARLFKKAKKLLKSIRQELEVHTGALWVEANGEPAGIVSRTEEEMEWIEERIAILAAKEPTLGWQRNSVYLRFGHRDYQKGSSLSEVARRYNLGAAACFAIGDGHNDLSKLHPAHAAKLACPGNAVEVVKARVRSHGGYLAEQPHGAGVVESLRHFWP